MQGLPDNSITRDSWIYQFPGPAIGKVFSGNKELAQEYLGVGMNLLFNVKSIMRNGLLGSLSMHRTLEDGTVIRVDSFYGNDRIMIDAPFPKILAVEALQDFIFKITRDDGVLMTNDPSLMLGANFYVYDPATSTTYTGMYPTSEYDYISTLVVSYEDGLWTLRKRNVLPEGVLNAANGTVDNFDITGDYFDQDEKYFVSYQFTGVSPLYYNWTQYPGKENILDREKDEDSISPGYYEDIIKLHIIAPPVTWGSLIFHGVPAPSSGQSWDCITITNEGWVSHPRTNNLLLWSESTQDWRMQVSPNDLKIHNGIWFQINGPSSVGSFICFLPAIPGLGRFVEIDVYSSALYDGIHQLRTVVVPRLDILSFLNNNLVFHVDYMSDPRDFNHYQCSIYA